MTVGQRIAQKRKELGLSQEGLGERLGVSRQTVYKWESDAALPEIEKLVKLGREFSVSIDWLLGQEDEPRELTAEQLRMVEEIVGRYLAARPEGLTALKAERSGGASETAPAPKRRKWPWVLAAAALLAVFVNLFIRLDQVNTQYEYLSSSLYFVQQDIGGRINGITDRMEDILQSQNALTAEQSAEVASTDYAANTVTVSAQAVPRTYVEGMTAEFTLASGRETVTVPGALGEDHGFTARITGPLSDDITISVAFLTGDQRQTQLLNQFTYLYSESFPDVLLLDDLWGSSDKVAEYADVRVSRKDADRISSLRLGLFRDGKLLAWYEHLDEKPSGYLGERPDTEFFRLDGEYTLEPGHEYCQAAVVVDEYGRERVYTNAPPVVYDPEEGFANYVESAYEPNYDPADWDY